MLKLNVFESGEWKSETTLSVPGMYVYGYRGGEGRGGILPELAKKFPLTTTVCTNAK